MTFISILLDQTRLQGDYFVHLVRELHAVHRFFPDTNEASQPSKVSRPRRAMRNDLFTTKQECLTEPLRRCQPYTGKHRFACLPVHVHTDN